MRFWLTPLLLGAVLVAGCASFGAPSAAVRPPRAQPLEVLLANTEAIEGVRIEEAVWLKPYPVSGAGGLASLRRELDLSGPFSESAGRHFDGLTAWALRWTFTYNDSPGGCSLRNATIELEAVITLPQIQDESALPDGQLALWQDYLQRLRDHEDGHVAIYRNGARDLAAEFLQTAPLPDCRQMSAQLAALGNAKIEALRAADLRFDAETGHGATFPLP